MTVIEWNQAFIIAAYSITWVVLLGYALRLARKGGAARVEFERMAREHSIEGGQ